jgi:glycosyltransferase involved in cell wall biosynthesis
MKIQFPKISIITPSLNQVHFIEETILSVLSQDYPNLDYIIIDGGSTDGTIEILHKYTDRLKWHSDKDDSQTQAINKGLRMAGGDIVAYLNSDDILFPGALEKVAEAFQTHPESKWVTGDCIIIDENSKETRHLISIYKKFLLSFKSFHLLLVTDFISQPATFWRKELIDEIGLLDENFFFAMDYDYFLRIWQEYRPLITRDVLAGFRIHQHSKSTSLDNYETYVQEEKMSIRRYTKSQFWLKMHDLHRLLMTTIYSKINTN